MPILLSSLSRQAIADLPSLQQHLVYWSAVLNGVVAVPVMILMMRMTMRPAIMVDFTLPPALQLVGWLATGAMAGTVVAMLATWIG